MFLLCELVAFLILALFLFLCFKWCDEPYTWWKGVIFGTVFGVIIVFMSVGIGSIMKAALK